MPPGASRASGHCPMVATPRLAPSRVVLDGRGLTDAGMTVDGAADGALAQCEVVLGDVAAADRHFRSAIDLEERTGGAAALARTRLWFGRFLLDQSSAEASQEARVQLGLARSAAEALGLQQLAEDTVVLTRRAWRRPNRRRHRSGSAPQT